MTDKYILDGKKTVPCNDLLVWGKWFGTADRIVAVGKVGDVSISTVFLGLNHNYGEGEPILFETMVFGGDLDQDCERYSTWEQAEAGHAVMMGKVSESMKDKQTRGL